MLRRHSWALLGFIGSGQVRSGLGQIIGRMADSAGGAARGAVQACRTPLQRAQFLEQWARDRVEKLLLANIAHLHQRHVGESGLEKRLYALRALGQVGPARYRAGNVVEPYELTRAGEPGWRGQLGINGPAA